MKNFALAIAWNWEYDGDFIELIENECQLRGISVLNLQPSNLMEIFQEIVAGQISFRWLYDRASDEDASFLNLIDAIEHRDIKIINPHRYIEQAKDKATMHLELIAVGIQVPFTIILSPYNQQNHFKLDEAQIEKLGIPFVIKPANTTGGGIGVVHKAVSMSDIIESRRLNPDDKYLLQERIYPMVLGSSRAWFRVFYAFGEVIICWWDDTTHLYRQCSVEDEMQFGLSELRDIMVKIQSVCKLNFFSSEVALTSPRKFVVIDYVNEICDMRFQSKYEDGVPDAVVQKIVSLLVDRVVQENSSIKN